DHRARDCSFEGEDIGVGVRLTFCRSAAGSPRSWPLDPTPTPRQRAHPLQRPVSRHLPKLTSRAFLDEGVHTSTCPPDDPRDEGEIVPHLFLVYLPGGATAVCN